MGNHTAIARVAAMTVMTPVGGADVDFNIAPDDGCIWPDTQDGVEKVRPRLQVPVPGLDYRNKATVSGG